MIKKPTNRNFRLSPDNCKIIQRLTEEKKLDNPNQTLNAVVQRYGEFKLIEPLFLSFVGFYEAFNALAMQNVYTMVKEADLATKKYIQTELSKKAVSGEFTP